MRLELEEQVENIHKQQNDARSTADFDGRRIGNIIALKSSVECSLESETSVYVEVMTSMILLFKATYRQEQARYA